MGSNRHLASRSVQPLEAGSRKRWKAAKTEQATCTGTQQNARSAQERYRAWAPPGRPSYTGHTGMGVARIFIDFVWELLLQGSFSGGGGPLWYWCFSSFSAACPRVRQRDGEIFPNRSAAGPDQQHLKCVRNEFAIHLAQPSHLVREVSTEHPRGILCGRTKPTSHRTAPRVIAPAGSLLPNQSPWSPPHPSEPLSRRKVQNFLGASNVELSGPPKSLKAASQAVLCVCVFQLYGARSRSTTV